ncbi:MAG: NAD(P)-dependent alcohol dehydrogenase [Spirochaetes bacterium]|nr:MAG: NAD(P)-dependent alcohol dehydrogenase [Spirochaetota bacterium]RKX98829.1 MAG: NAD(P)-dependent alcohol dehydrogenase [Spirochaetota bacterium]
MKALVLEEIGKISFQNMDVYENMGPNDVRIRMKRVGICGSDVHFYEFGRIGPFVVQSPMILGHEGSGEVIAVGENVSNLRIGDRVCMEPGIPNPLSRANRLGIYNLDPELTFWATPPIHGCMCTEVVHPASLTYRVPDNITFEEAAMVEPLAIGMHASMKAEIKPGDKALVYGAGTIGVMTALAALAGGCSTVIVADIRKEKLRLLDGIPGCITCDVSSSDLASLVSNITEGWGVNLVFEASGSEAVARELFNHACPGGHVVYIGMPSGLVPIDITIAQTKEIRIDTIFRYANVYDRSLALLGSNKIDLKPFITDEYPFSKGIEAFNYARTPKPSSVKIMINMDG